VAYDRLKPTCLHESLAKGACDPGKLIRAIVFTCLLNISVLLSVPVTL
jgi:hypothetical protein